MAGLVRVSPASLKTWTNTTGTAITAAAVVAAPTLASQGQAVADNPRFLHLACVTSGNAGAVEFQVWWWLDGPDLWMLDRTFGNGGTIDDLTAITEPGLLLTAEAPGDRVYIAIPTNAASTTLTITPVAVVEGF